jgi:hypothetical protein
MACAKGWWISTKGESLVPVGQREIYDISLRDFLKLFERECVDYNWDSGSVKEYLKQKYGE